MKGFLDFLRTSMKLLIIVLVVLIVLYALRVLVSYWLLMFAVIFLVVGFVRGFILLGSGEEDPGIGMFLMLIGAIILAVMFFFPL